MLICPSCGEVPVFSPEHMLSFCRCEALSSRMRPAGRVWRYRVPESTMLVRMHADGSITVNSSYLPYIGASVRPEDFSLEEARRILDVAEIMSC